MLTQNDDGLRLSVVDLRNGVRSNQLQLKDSVLISAYPLNDGWVYMPASGDRMILVEGGKKREIAKSAWHQILTGISLSSDRRQIAYWGWNNGSNDSIGYDIMPIAGGPATRIYTSFAEKGAGMWLDDGSFLARVFETPDAVTLTKISGSGKPQRLGTIPHQAFGFNTSRDLKRASLVWQDKRADAFMYRVVKE
jgi:hypothetical protein